MDSKRGYSSNELNDLFDFKCTFDPLKAIIKKLTERQNELEIEIKLLKTDLQSKADKKEIDDFNQKVR